MKKLLILLCIPLCTPFTSMPMKHISQAWHYAKTTYCTVAAAKHFTQKTTNMIIPVLTNEKLYNFTCAHITLNYLVPNATKFFGAIGRPWDWCNNKLLHITTPLFIFTTWYKVTHEQATLHKETQEIVNNNTNSEVKKVSDKLSAVEDLIKKNTLLLEQLRDGTITKEEFNTLYVTTEEIRDTVQNIDTNKLDTSYFDTKIETLLHVIKKTNTTTQATHNNTTDILKFISVIQQLLEHAKEKNELLKKVLLKQKNSQSKYLLYP